MKHLSLTARMSLMFMLAVIAVLTVAGLSFNELSRHHFMMLDQQTLDEKLESTQQILSNTRSHLCKRRHCTFCRATGVQCSRKVPPQP